MEAKNMWYEEDPHLSLVVCNRGKIEKISSPFRPYCFIERTKERVAEYYLKRFNHDYQIEETELKTLDGEKVDKVEVTVPRQIKVLRERLPIQVFEADIPFVRRVLIDMNWQVSQDYKIGYWDMEVDEKTDKIVAISLVNCGNEECFMGEEEEIIDAFLDEARKCEMLVGYNSDLYDYPRLLQAVKKLKNSTQALRYWRYLDLLQFIRSRLQRMLQSWSLQYVAETFVGEGRVHTEKKIHELTGKEIEERCLRDAVLLKMLDQKLSLVDVAIALAKISYIFPDETYLISRCVDGVILKKARQLGYVLPSKPKNIKNKGSYEGAMVLCPPEPFKVYKDITVLDFASLYPSIVIQYGISPDAEKRLYPEAFLNLLETRLRLKEEWKRTGDPKINALQQAYKLLLNASYGVMASSHFRVQRADLSAEIARRGRELLQRVIEALTTAGYNVIYGDTDSVFVQGRPEELLERVAGLNPGFKVEVDKMFSRLYFPKRASDSSASKKRYAGLTTEGKLETVGMETVRSDYPQAARMLQRTLIELHLNETSKEYIEQVVRDFKTVLFSGLLDVDSLTIYKTYTRENYKVKTPHSVVVSSLREKGVNVMVGDKVGFVYTASGPRPAEDGVVPDYKYYWHHIFEPMIERTVGLTLREDESLDGFL